MEFPFTISFLYYEKILLVADLRIGLKFLFSSKVQINIRGVVSHYVFHGKNHLLLYSFLVNTIWHLGINLEEGKK